MSPEGKQTARLRVSGRVQGVGYRFWTIDCATRLGLAGWVRNCADGTVEIEAFGTGEDIQNLIAQCHEGPKFASVEGVEIVEKSPGDPAGLSGQGFKQAH